MNRILKRYYKLTAQIRIWQRKMQALEDDQLAALTDQFRARRSRGESLERLLPEAFAAICEADRRVLHKEPYDVQILGGLALHEGRLAEIGTGEGKTLIATMPLYLNALDGNGVFLATTNEYLAVRDYNEMGPVFQFMGLSVACGVAEQRNLSMSRDEKKRVYASDIVYTTHGALGFDYLMNNLVASAQERFLCPLHYIVIDEADSVLLDSAQTPLVISGSPRVQSNLYQVADNFVTLLQEDVDFETEEKCVWLTAEGVRKAEAFFGIGNFYDDRYFEVNRHVNLALRAHVLFTRGKEYAISDAGKLVLLDSGTGRMMPGVKLRGGQHQALEVKEGLPDSQEMRSVASITFQNLFLLFDKMAGMSGTFFESRHELEKTYHTKVVVIPPNRPMIRQDLPDVYLFSPEQKFDRAVKAGLEAHTAGRPVLMVASTIAETEYLSRAFIQHGVPHNVLNANNTHWEADIIAEAGQRGAVTVATAMAGRGTDIRLGEAVADLGGLAIIGVGRMADKRIERQVRGRAGRQGDPGTSQFFVSLHDEVVTRNQIDQVERLDKPSRKPHPRTLRRIVDRAQALEAEYAALARKNVTDYDKVIKKQRILIYALRDRLLDGGTISTETFFRIAKENVRGFLQGVQTPNEAELNRYILDNISYRVVRTGKVLSRRQARQYLMECIQRSLEEQQSRIGNERSFFSFLRIAVLNAIDEAWVEQVDYLQQLQAAVSGRASAQRNVTEEYQNEAYEAYRKMERRIKQNLMRSILLSSVQVDKTAKLHIVFP